MGRVGLKWGETAGMGLAERSWYSFFFFGGWTGARVCQKGDVACDFGDDLCLKGNGDLFDGDRLREERAAPGWSCAVEVQGVCVLLHLL